ncbi:MAG: hypothetical protein EGP87_11795 [Paraprevotella clara]|jgi:hypothetical protein|nr:hypothetical protein [Paraprevotella clara]RGU64367.1 hypothetical protein DWW55_05835 [Paraprevotella clara]
MSLSIKTESDMVLSPNDVILIWVHFLNPDKKVRNAAGWAVACAKCDKKKNMNMFRRSMNDYYIFY